MKLFDRPLLRYNQYHTTPRSRFKEYVSKLPLSSMSRHNRGGGVPHGAPPGHGWNVRAPITFQPYEFENAGDFPLPKTGFWDSDALDKDRRAMTKPFGTLPPGLGGPYGGIPSRDRRTNRSSRTRLERWSHGDTEKNPEEQRFRILPPVWQV